MSGYLLALGRVVYEHGDGRPFTLGEAFAECEGVGNVNLLRVDGSLCLGHAGNLGVRAALRRADSTDRRTVAVHYRPAPRRRLP